jgi:hypothetical protein
VIIPLVAIIGHCAPSDFDVRSKHYIDTTLQRTEQVEKCATCHKEVYDNWKLDSHGNAFYKLEEHLKLIDTSANFPKVYSTFVKSAMKDICISCHTGQNIYDTNFRGLSHNCVLSPSSNDSFPNAFKQAFSRDINNRNELITGVDCITCHAQNGRVVTNANSKVSTDSGIIKSKLFASNMNCFSCHHHQVYTMQDLVRDQKISREIGCVSCHQEYDEKGKGTHYFYWRNNHSSKKQPKHLIIFECVKLAIVEKNKNKRLQFNWTNTLMPHGYSECGEAKCVIKVVQKNGKNKVVIEQLLNRKNFFDKIDKMPQHFKMGENGNEFIYNVPIVKEVNLNNYESIDHFVIEGYVKPQYWSSSQEFIKIYKRELKL